MPNSTRSFLLAFAGCSLFCRQASAEPSFPSLPNSASIEYEVSNLVQNFSYAARDYIDFEGNRERYDTQYNGTHESFLFDYDYNVTFRYSQDSCVILPVDVTSTLPSGHIKSIKDLLYINTSSIRYIGEATVRGMAADVWKETNFISYSSWSNAQTSYNVSLQLYFLKSTWTTKQGGAGAGSYGTLLRVVEQGVATSSIDSTVTPVHNNWEFFNWRSGRPEHHVFGRSHLAERYQAICPTWEHPRLHISIPPLPDTFSSRIEANIGQNNYSLERRDIFDSTKNRIGHITHLPQGGFVKRITYFNPTTLSLDDTTYTVKDDGTCTTLFETSAANSFNRAFDLKRRRMKHTAVIFGETSGNFSHEGRTHIRGIKAHHWMKRVKSHRLFFRPANLSYTVSYYFAAEPPWSVRTFFRTAESNRNNPSSPATTSWMPLRVKIKGHEANGTFTKLFHHSYEFVDFVAAAPPDAEFGPPVECSQEASTEGFSYSESFNIGVSVVITLIIALPIGGLIGYQHHKAKAELQQNDAPFLEGGGPRKRGGSDVEHEMHEIGRSVAAQNSSVIGEDGPQIDDNKGML